MGTIAATARWLERNVDPDAPVERVFDGFGRVFPGADDAWRRTRE